MNPFVVIKSVRLTEKGTRQSDQVVRYQEKDKQGNVTHKTRPLNQYTVVVDPRANKIQIRDAVEELFKVTVLNVNTLNVRGKARRKRTTQAGSTSDWKKAIVTLKEGEKISLT
ncbi:MAG: 50S ribosomal protein L23 [Pedosphaera parvula]|nr:50S ribosomal protein L23 [Pedosphaera parvula]